MSESSDRGPIYIGAEVLESGLRAVCLSSEGEILEKTLISGEATAEALPDFVKSAVERHGALKGAGIAAASEFDAEVARVSNDLFRIAGTKPSLINSAQSGSYGEFRMGAGRDCPDVFYFTLGSPVGGALILGGNPWSGAAGLPCEFGSIVIDSEGRNINDFATDESILRRTRNRFNQDHTSSLVSLDENAITVADIIKEAVNGDDFAQMMLERTGRFAGKGVAAVINLLNVQKVIVGGAIVREGTNVIEGVVAGAKEASSPASFDAVEIVPAELGVFSAAVGAALTAMER